MANQKIYVLDCGGQYAHLIASRIRKYEALSVIVPADTPASELTDAGAVIVSGGPQSVYDPESLTVDNELWNLPCPILGICYGMQLMCHNLGGKVETAEAGEYGRAQIEVVKPDATLFEAVPAQSDAWMSHRDRVVTVPDGFEAVCTTEECPFAAVQCVSDGRKIFGVQFHPEVTHTKYGETILGNFVTLAGLQGSWKMENFIEQQISKIQAKCEGGRKVFMLVSGGVDSTVVFSLLCKAVPGKVIGLFVDTGMMRHEEGKMVQAALQETFQGAKLHFVNAESEFLQALEGETAPEVKRRIIGQMFLEVKKTKCAEFGLNPDEWLLGQGTIYPDTIESGGKKKGSTQVADVIKTHHNRVPEIEALIEAGLVIEPCADLYKDEVREVGEKLGLPSHLVWRHPFPGPGLGVRLLCHPGGDAAADMDMDALAAQIEAMRALAGEGVTVTVPLLKSVGVQGDSRTYKNFAILGGSYPRDWPHLDALATKIINTQTMVNRVTVSLCFNEAGCEQPSYTVPTEAATCTAERFARLRAADHIVHQELLAANLMSSVWQCPVAMAPLANVGAEETIIMRPVTSTEAMTAEFSRLPWDVVLRIGSRVKSEVGGVLDVLYDITNKPPGTIEWE
jgi:GMP synthase (glutamine-hydrolysing)